MNIPIDVVVAIDGFNEAAMGGMDCEGGYDPLFPSAHHYLSMLQLVVRDASADVLERALQISRLRQRERTLRTALAGSPLRRLETVNAVLGVLADRAHRAAVAIEQHQQAEAAGDLGQTLPVATLTRRAGQDSSSCLAAIGDLWARSSLAMAALARQRGIPYVHVLQPNQYVGAPKPLTDEERKAAWQPESPWAHHAAVGYAAFRERSARLLADGVRFGRPVR